MIDLTVKTLDSQNHAFNVDETITVAQFKQKVHEKINIPVETQRIIYCGRVLKDEHKLSEYDLNGKVVHLVQRAPPSAGGHGNSNTGQRRSRSISPSAQHRRRTPGGNTMYVGSMSFPANFVEGFIPPPPPPTHTLAASRLNVAKRMLSLTEARLASPGDPSPAASTSPTDSGLGSAGTGGNPIVAAEGSVIEMQIVSGDIEQAIDWFENLENDYMDESDQTRSALRTSPLQSSANQPAAADQPPTTDQPPQIEDEDLERDQHLAHGHHVVDVVEVAFLEDPEPEIIVEDDQGGYDVVQSGILGPEPSIPVVPLDADANIAERETGTAGNKSETSTEGEQCKKTETAAGTNSNNEPSSSSAQTERTRRTDAATETAAGPNQNTATGSNICRTSAMATHLDTLQRIQQNFAPLLERYHQFMRDDPVIPTEDVDSTQSMLEQVSDVFHLLGHAYHSLSDIFVRAYATPPRALLCCPILVHSGVMHSSLPLPIQLEAQINFNHGGNGTNSARNGLNNNTTAGQQGGQPQQGQQQQQQGGGGTHTTTRIGIPIDANALTAQLAPILASVAAAVQQQQQNQQVPTAPPSATTPPSTTVPNNGSAAPDARVTGVYAAAAGGASGGGNGRGPVYRMQSGGNGGLNGLSNVEYSFELLDDLPVDSEPEGGHESGGEQMGGEANGESPTASNTAPVTTCSGSSLASSTVGTTAPATSGNNGRGQNSQARGNTATNPTTTQATRTRSTSRPHVHLTPEHAAAAAALNNLFGGHGHGEPLFDPYLRCSSHHLHHHRNGNANNNNNGVGTVASQQQNRGTGTVNGPVLAAGHVQVQMHGPRRLGQGGGSSRARLRGQSGANAAQSSTPTSATSSPSRQRQTAGQGPAGTAQQPPPVPPGISLPPAMNAAIYQMAQGLMDNIQTVFSGTGSPPETSPQQQQDQSSANPPNGSSAGAGVQTGQTTGQPDWLRGLLDTFSFTGAERGAADVNQQQGRSEGTEATNSMPVPLLLSQAVGRMVRDLTSGAAAGANTNPATGASILIDVQDGVRLSDMLGMFQQQQSPTHSNQQQQQQQSGSGSVIDSFYTLIRRKLTLQDLFSLSTGNLDILQQFRGDIRTLVLTQLLNNSTSPEAIDRGVNIVLNDLEPYLSSLTFLTPIDINTHQFIDIVASATSLLRARLPNILQLAASPRTDNSRALADQLRTTVEQLVALIIHVSPDGVRGLERLIEYNVNQILRNFPEAFRRTTLQDLHQRYVAPFTAQAASVPDSLLQPYLVRRDSSVAIGSQVEDRKDGGGVEKEGTSSNQKDNKQQTDDAMDVDEDLVEGTPQQRRLSSVLHRRDAEEEEERIIDLLRGPDMWQSQVPQDWVPIITRDVSRQQQSTRRPSDSGANINQSPLSDAYLSGMPSKRRKLVTDAKPQLHCSGGNVAQNGNTGHSSNSLQLQRVISDGVRRAVNQTVVGQRGNAVEGVAEEIGADAGVQVAYRDLVRASVAASVRGNVDLTEERFPNACKYFISSSEVNKPNIP